MFSIVVSCKLIITWTSHLEKPIDNHFKHRTLNSLSKSLLGCTLYFVEDSIQKIFYALNIYDLKVSNKIKKNYSITLVCIN